ncbi:glycogen-binding domain-containing protein, partial [bacterium]|nr:glycogen-binding domain-containing protein [bacterium]
YEYKFVVDGTYIEDPDNPDKISDPYGGNNSVFTVDVAAESPATQGLSEIAVKEGVVLEYYNPSARSVSVAGSFNNWSSNADPFDTDGEGNWSITLELDPGKYEYKFVVDDSWQPDSDNPRSESDGYGGINSVIEIDLEGKLVKTEVDVEQEKVSNTFLNSRVYIGGKYTAIAESRWARDFDGRFRLDKPRHRLESYIRIKISNDVTAWGGINMDTRDAGRIYEASLALDSAAIELVGNSIEGQVYYNRPVGGIGDPLEIIGSSIIAGAPGETLPFGLGTGGAFLKGEIYSVAFRAIYCDRFESWATEEHTGEALLDNLGRLRYGLFREDVIDPFLKQDVYTEYSTDIFGLSLSRRIGPLDLGVALRYDSGIFWYSLTELDIPSLQNWVDSTGSESDWFALGNSELLWGGFTKIALGPGSIWAEYLSYNYDGGVQAGNLENDAGDGNGSIDVELGKMYGHFAGLGLMVNPYDEVGFKLGYSSQVFSAPEDTGVFFLPAPSTDDDGHVDIEAIEIEPGMDPTWWESYFAQVNIDLPVKIWARGGIEAMDDHLEGNKRKVNRFGVGARGTVLWNFIGFDMFNDWAFAKLPQGVEQREALSKVGIRLHLSDQWYVNLDVAYHKIYCENALDSIEIDETAIPVFAGIQFMPVENVRLELYWGLHPLMANGWRAGRREFVEKYMNDNSVTFAESWKALENVRQIGLRGEIDF